jgi:hypothetical protein
MTSPAPSSTPSGRAALVCLGSVALLRETKDADFTDGMKSTPAR